ncbi:MAG: hypothetical protein ACP5HU_02340 [Phycisphaerae bacterium]
MVEIPLPPTPQLPMLWAWIASAASLVVGAAVLLWGRHLHRALLVLVAAGLGVLLAGPIAAHFGWNLVVLRVVLAVALGITALLAARVVWAVLAAGLTVLVIGSIFLWSSVYRSGESFAAAEAPESASKWLTETARVCFDALNQTTAMPLAIAVAFTVGGAVLVIMFIRPVAARILMTSVVAAVVLMGGLLLAALRVRESLWQTAWTHAYVPAAGTAALILVGWVWQFIYERRERRQKKKEQQDESNGNNGKKASAKGK